MGIPSESYTIPIVTLYKSSSCISAIISIHSIIIMKIYIIVVISIIIAGRIITRMRIFTTLMNAHWAAHQYNCVKRLLGECTTDSEKGSA